MSLGFLLEPALEEVGRAATAADGEYALDLPAGDYSVLLSGGNGAPPERVRVRVEAEVELNFVRSEAAER